MPQLIAIEGVGTVEFPDDATEAEVLQAADDLSNQKVAESVEQALTNPGPSLQPIADRRPWQDQSPPPLPDLAAIAPSPIALSKQQIIERNRAQGIHTIDFDVGFSAERPSTEEFQAAFGLGPTSAKVVGGLYDASVGMAEGMLQPEGVSMLGLAPVAKAGNVAAQSINRALAGGFAGTMAMETPHLAAETSKAAGAGQVREAVGYGLQTAAMPVFIKAGVKDALGIAAVKAQAAGAPAVAEVVRAKARQMPAEEFVSEGYDNIEQGAVKWPVEETATPTAGIEATAPKVEQIKSVTGEVLGEKVPPKLTPEEIAAENAIPPRPGRIADYTEEPGEVVVKGEEFSAKTAKGTVEEPQRLLDIIDDAKNDARIEAEAAFDADPQNAREVSRLSAFDEAIAELEPVAADRNHPDRKGAVQRIRELEADRNEILESVNKARTESVTLAESNAERVAREKWESEEFSAGAPAPVTTPPTIPKADVAPAEATLTSPGAPARTVPAPPPVETGATATQGKAEPESGASPPGSEPSAISTVTQASKESQKGEPTTLTFRPGDRASFMFGKKRQNGTYLGTNERGQAVMQVTEGGSTLTSRVEDLRAPVRRLKVGDEETIRSVPSFLIDTQTIEGVRWEIFDSQSRKDARASIRVTDVDSGEVLGITQFPSYETAAAHFKSETAKARRMEQPAAPPPAPPEAKAKEPWEMTRSELAERQNVKIKAIKQEQARLRKATPKARESSIYTKSQRTEFESRIRMLEEGRDNDLKFHHRAVEQALREGKPVPAEVLAEYPDLKPAEAKQPAARDVTKPEQMAPEDVKAVGKGFVPPRFAIKKPIKGPTGAMIIGYEWRSHIDTVWSEGKQEYVERRVSDWDASDKSTGTGRDIVHVFYVEHPGGNVTIEGINSAQNILGIAETRLQTIAKKQRAAQQYAKQQADAMESHFAKSAPTTVQEADAQYRTANSPDRMMWGTREQHVAAAEETFRKSTLLEKNGRFIRTGQADTIEALTERGWTRQGELYVPPAKSTAEAKQPAPEPTEKVEQKQKKVAGDLSLEFVAPSGHNSKVTVSSVKYADLSAEMRKLVDQEHRTTLEHNEQAFKEWDAIKQGKKKVTLWQRTMEDGTFAERVALDSAETVFGEWATRTDLIDVKFNEAGKAVRDKIVSEREASAAAENARKTVERETELAKERAEREYRETVFREQALPGGKKTKVFVPAIHEGKKTKMELEGTKYGDFLVSKHGKKGSFDRVEYRVTHVPSGLKLSAEGFGTLEAAKDYVRALLHAKVKTDWQDVNKLAPEDLEHFRDVSRHWVLGGNVPKYFTELAKPTPPAPKAEGEGAGAGGKSLADAESQLHKVISEVTQPKPGTLGIAMPGTAARPTDVVLGAADLKSTDPAAEVRWQEAVHRKPSIAARLLNAAQSTWHSVTREYADIPPRDFAREIDILRLLRASKNFSARKTVDILRGITADLGPKRYNVFNRVVVLEDLLKDVENGMYPGGTDIPLVGNEATLRADLAKFQTIADANPTIKNALARRRVFMDSLRDTLADRGILPESVKNDPRYFHHQVLFYMQGNVHTPGARSFREWFSGWQKKRTGSSLDYNRQYIEAEAEVIADAYNKLTMQDLQAKMKDTADIAPELQRIHGDTWKEHIPATHIPWQPKRGSVFYPVRTVTERLIDEYLNGLRDLLPDDFKQALALGARRPEWIIPKELAKVLDNLAPREDTWIEKMAGAGVQAWKRYILLMPLRASKYMVNNQTGDLDFLFAARPAVFKEFKQAAKDLHALHIRRGPATGDIADAMQSGVIGSGWRASELPNISSSEAFYWLTGEKPGLIKRYWDWIGKWNDLREDTGRLAAYRYALKEFNAGRTWYGASVPKDIDMLPTTQAKAAKIAREVLIDYGRETEFGEFMRRKFIPFYRWMHGNFARYMQLFKNVSAEGGAAGFLTRKAAITTAQLIPRAAFAYGIINLWNNLFFPDEERDLGEGRNQLHLILGRDKNGNVISIRFQGALSDLLGWVGLENLPADIKDLASGKSTLTDKAQDAYETAISRLVNSTQPFYKAIAESLAKQSYYPNALKPRPIRDRGEHLAGLFALQNVYRYVAGLPQSDMQKSIASLLTYSTDPGEAAYNATRHMAAEWLEKQGVDRPTIIPSKRSNALYFYKQALRYKNSKLADKFLAQYMILGGSTEGLARSITASDPLNSLGKQRSDFLKSLSPQDAAIVQRATDWYKTVFTKTPSTSPSSLPAFVY